MTWFRVDDNLAFHPKVLAAGNPAMGLWVRAGSWVAQQLTDGHVPAGMVANLGARPKDVQALLSAGLWVPTDGGFGFHEWSAAGRQPTKEAVLADRAAAAERQKRARDKAREEREAITLRSQSESRRDSGRSNSTNHGPPDPTRPDPPSPSGDGETSSAEPASPSGTRRRSRVPTDFELDDGMRAWAKDRVPQVDVDKATEQFLDHHRAKGSVMADWRAAWMTWMRNVPRYGGPGAPDRSSTSPTDERVAGWQDLKEGDRGGP